MAQDHVDILIETKFTMFSSSGGIQYFNPFLGAGSGSDSDKSDESDPEPEATAFAKSMGLIDAAAGTSARPPPMPAATSSSTFSGRDLVSYSLILFSFLTRYPVEITNYPVYNTSIPMVHVVCIQRIMKICTGLTLTKITLTDAAR